MSEYVARSWAVAIPPPPWLPWAVAVLAVLVASWAVWIMCGS